MAAMDALKAHETVSRYEIPIGHLDFAYVKKCTDVNELVKIYKVLKSGDEGTFIELERCTEDRIRELAPEHRILRIDEPIGSLSQLEEEERCQILEEIESLKQHEKHKKQKQNGTKKHTPVGRADIDVTGAGGDAAEKLHEYQFDDRSLPTVRRGKTINVTTTTPAATNGHAAATAKPAPSSKPKNPLPRSYKDWDKFDVDKALEEDRVVEENTNTINPNSAPAKKPTAGNDDQGDATVGKLNKNTPAPDKLKRRLANVPRSNVQKVAVSTKEKDKGNEAFRAGDYNEALLYYDRALSVFENGKDDREAVISELSNDESLKNVYLDIVNNRALACLKLERWAKTIGDTDFILSHRLDDKKALWRRACAYKGRRQFSAAQQDVNKLLRFDPQNARAAELLREVEKEMGESQRQGNRLVIEEVSSSEDEEEEEEEQEAEDVSPMPQAPINSSQGVTCQEVTDEDESETSNCVTSSTETNANNNEQAIVEEEMTEVKSEVRKTIVLPQLPTSLKSVSEAANASFKRGAYDEAAASYTKIVDQLKSAKSPPTTEDDAQLALQWSNLAAARLKTGDPAGAVAAADESLRLLPFFWKSLLRRAQAYEMRDSSRWLALAYVDYRLVAAWLRPGDDAALRGRDRCATALKDAFGTNWKEKCVAKFADVAKAFADDRMPSVEEIPIVEKALTASEADERFERCRAAGAKMAAAGDWPNALVQFSECHNLRPGDANPLCNRSLANLRLNRPTAALADANTCIKLDATNVKAHYRRGLALRDLKRVDEAEQSFTEALKLAPDNENIQQEVKTLRIQIAKQKRAEADRREREELLAKEHEAIEGDWPTIPENCTTTEFWRLWRELPSFLSKPCRDGRALARLFAFFDDVPTERIPELLSTHVTSHQLSNLIAAAVAKGSDEEIVAVRRRAHFLEALTRCPRFQTLHAFIRDAALTASVRGFLEEASVLIDERQTQALRHLYKIN